MRGENGGHDISLQLPWMLFFLKGYQRIESVSLGSGAQRKTVTIGQYGTWPDHKRASQYLRFEPAFSRQKRETYR